MKMENREEIQVILGMDPYVLIEIPSEGIGEDGFEMSVRAGGGITGTDEIVVTLLSLVEQITGVEAGDYAQKIDAERKREA